MKKAVIHALRRRMKLIHSSPLNTEVPKVKLEKKGEKVKKAFSSKIEELEELPVVEKFEREEENDFDN